MFKNLVFEGGGVWGIAYQGVLTELHVQNAVDLKSLERVAGASAGAITACLISVGYTPDELGEEIANKDFGDFQDDDWGFGRDTARLIQEFGWYKGDKFKKWIRDLIRRKIRELSKSAGIAKPATRPTFKQLNAWHKALKKKGINLPSLYIVGTNLSKQRREVYSHEASHEPGLYIDDAVRRSMSIPLYFACSRGKNRDVIVDGGLTWNYPVNIFDDKKYLSAARFGKPISYATRVNQVFNTETLGFRLDTPAEIASQAGTWANQAKDIEHLIHYFTALAAFVRAMANKSHLKANDFSRTVVVDVGDEIGFTDFKMSEQQKAFLVEAGKEGVRNYLKWQRSKSGQKDLERIYKKMATK
jgi:NTE family protein